MRLNVLSRLRGSPFAFPLAALTALAVFFISETSYHQASDSLDSLGVMGTARIGLQNLSRGLIDAETGERGYLLTGRQEYLQPYTDALGRVQKALGELSRYYADDKTAAPLMASLRELSGQKLSEMQTTLQLYDSGKADAWRNLLLTDIGREKMDAVRGVLEQLTRLETDRILEKRKSVYETLQLNRIGVSAMTALSLLALFMYLRQTATLERHRSDAQRVVQAERDQLEIEVERRTSQLTELARHLQSVREDERNRLARELHDELGALLTAAKLDVARLKSRLGAITPEVGERITHLNDALNSGIALKRRIIEDLRPSSLANLGLVAALDILIQEFSTRYEVKVEPDLKPVLLAPSGELTVYRLVQEALTNVAKYAKAKTIEVSLGAQGGRVRVRVRDDGIGFDQSQPRAAAHGLLGMRYRVEAEGGRMTLQSAPGRGTTIEATIPERTAPAAASPLAAG
ncbi:MAG: CHASE3 domain-containing protein [Proteobacteria bacterium]|nr:CHASE3 domain-containing protein [Pseudomonadota bacterium]